jgi:hypothetical protein
MKKFLYENTISKVSWIKATWTVRIHFLKEKKQKIISMNETGLPS